jgi:hypothetical protein
MTESILPAIMTVEDMAGYLKVDNKVVISELEQGHIHGFKVGTEWRCTEASLLDYINGKHHSVSLAQSGIPAWKSEETGFTEIGSFDFQWPGGKEHFENGYETTRSVEGRSRTFRIGFTDRPAAGQKRRRVVVWMNNWPLVEFAGGNNYESDGFLASVIKVKGGKQLRASANIPDAYKEFSVVRYDSIVQGPYASRNMAVVAHKSDLESMLKHAIIRAQLKELI